MGFFREMGILEAVTLPLVALGLLARNRLARKGRPTLAGAVVVVAATVGLVVGSIIVFHGRDAAEAAARDRMLEHFGDAECAKPATGDADAQGLHELMCARDVRTAFLRTAGVSLSVDTHDQLLGVVALHLPPVPGKTYVVWLLDRGGRPVAHATLDPARAYAIVRDPHVTEAADAALTLEATPAAQPSGPPIARAALMTL